jgi:two-component system response regulator RegX3
MTQATRGASPRVLVIEGQEANWNELIEGLCIAGYEVEAVHDWESAQRQVLARPPDIIFLDLTKSEQGMSLFRQVRALVAAPLLIISSPEAGIDVADGLEMGATDVVITPFRTRAVIARVGAVLRRVAASAGGGEAVSDAFLSAGPLMIDRNHRTAIIGERSVYLRPIEYKLLMLLASAPGRVRTREELTDRLWGDRSPRSNQSLHAQMHNLRLKVERNPSAPELIMTIKGVGFKLNIGAPSPLGAGTPSPLG